MRIAPHIEAALDKWGAGQPHPTGDFLRAVLSNDLFGAARRADPMNRYTLADIVLYVITNLPDECYGSPEKYEAWVAKHRAREQSRRAQQETQSFEQLVSETIVPTMLGNRDEQR